MTANELADLIGMCGDGGYNQDAAAMLRQQAKELDEAGHMIGVLREYISDLENGLDSSIKLNKAQAERNNEPVAWMSQGGDVSRSADYFEEMGFKDLIPLYTHPAQKRTMVLDGNRVYPALKELTDEEIGEVEKLCKKPLASWAWQVEFARAILRKAQEK